MVVAIDTFPFGVLLVRMTAGILFFFQGYDKVFRVGIHQVIDTINEPMKKAYLPDGWLRPMILLSSYIELIGGLLLALGLLGVFPQLILGADLLVVAFVFSTSNAMWDMQFYFPRFIMIVFLLLVNQKADVYRLDGLIR